MFNSILRKVFYNIQLVRNPIIIDAFVFNKSFKVIHKKWGDDLNYYFLAEIIRRPILIYNLVSLAFRLKLKNYLIIGSTIDMLCKENTEVWGAGILHGEQQLKVRPTKVYAVRGPLTRKVLLSNNIECPEIYGDPALLLPLVYCPKVEKKFTFGIIIHDYTIKGVDKLTIDGQKVSDRKDILMIDLSDYLKWTDIIDKILSCQYILSYSLHGLITAEAYKVPNVWIEFDEHLYGGHFKFHDFFLSLGHDRTNPVPISENNIQSILIQQALSKWEPSNINLTPLIKACPFDLCFKQIYTYESNTLL